ncbi:MAG: DUF4907 domain-containing protein [Chryseolinea sp.]
MRSIHIVLLAALMFGCGKQEKETAAEQSAPIPSSADSAAVTTAPANFRYQIIEAPEKTFGYDVYRDEALFIHQPHIPGMAGVKGFESEDQAKKAAELMIEKMKNGEVPPTLSEEEIADILKK